MSCLLPPGTCLQFLSRIGFSIPTARRSSWNVAKSHSHMKNKNTACYYKCCCSNTSGVIKCMRVVLLSCHCFRNPDALDPRLGLVRDVRWWLRKTLEVLRAVVARHRLEIWLWVLLDKYHTGLQHLFYHRCVKCALSYIKKSRRSDEIMWFSLYAFYQDKERC